ncbi:UbiA prenyltransferase [Epithele typhae]|uniref:UbiA prenyltransferase n=1 Tax=Epithele typhae TaxID=378194 RepID=UPI0020074032|nr:UbiA prenyltransferase [Epithele typhae]KAH9917679.1 UbiA prenyltransferase [Epithele typhae]
MASTSSSSKQTASGYFQLTRLHKPFMGNTLLFWPCAWGLTLAARATNMPLDTYATYLTAFFYDKLVERTRTRPLPSGRASISGAIALYFALQLPAVLMIALTNKTTALLTLISMFPIQGLYPLMKRWTYWPQAWLGLSFNCGVPVGWASVTGQYPPPSVWLLALGGTCWTIFYDTIYACQDREDDKRVGIKSTAVLFGDRVRAILTLFAGAFVLCLAVAGAALGHGAAYLLLSCGCTLAHLGWQLWVWDDKDVRDSMLKFESNGFLAAVIWLGMFGDYLSGAARSFAL